MIVVRFEFRILCHFLFTFLVYRTHENKTTFTLQKKRPGKDEYWQGWIKPPCLDNIFEKGQRPDIVLPKRDRQGNRSLNNRIHPCLDGIKFYPCGNLSLPNRLFFYRVNGV